MKMSRRVALIAFVLAIVSLVKQDLLEGHGIKPVYAALNCNFNGQTVSSGSCAEDNREYCFDGIWYVAQDEVLPDGTVAPACPN